MHNELTRIYLKKMREELDYRRITLRPQLLEEVKVARSFGDLSENFEYKAAKQEKNRNESRIRYLENMIKTARIIEDHSDGQTVGLYDKVTIWLEEDEEEPHQQGEPHGRRPYGEKGWGPLLCAGEQGVQLLGGGPLHREGL